MPDSSSRIVGVPADLAHELLNDVLAAERHWVTQGLVLNATGARKRYEAASALLAAVPSSEVEETAAETAEANKYSRCRIREYVGDGVYYECSRLKGHDWGHDYGRGIGRPPRG